MKSILTLTAVSFTLIAAMAAEPAKVTPSVATNVVAFAKVPPNPAIDMDGYLKLASEAAEHRKTHRLTEEDFIKMSREKDTIILDARSKAMFDLLHVKGAINLTFPDIAIDSIKKAIPNKETRILIYCNNNFKNQPVAFAPKMTVASLNISTYISLYTYGYRNIYELGPLLDPKESKLEFESSQGPVNVSEEVH